jgi:hypothetical protein
MTIQTKILIGILIWLGGIILDGMLIPYLFIFIYAGFTLTFYGIIEWLLIKENRIRTKEVLGIGIKRNFLTLVQTAFDFSWRRVSVIWTMCFAFGMIIVFLGSLIKTSDVYKVAINSIKTDKEIIGRTGKIIHFTTVISGNISNYKASKINIGVIGQKESFWVTAHVDPTGDGYETTELEIKE